MTLDLGGDLITQALWRWISGCPPLVTCDLLIEKCDLEFLHKWVLLILVQQCEIPVSEVGSLQICITNLTSTPSISLLFRLSRPFVSRISSLPSSLLFSFYFHVEITCFSATCRFSEHFLFVLLTIFVVFRTVLFETNFL